MRYQGTKYSHKKALELFLDTLDAYDKKVPSSKRGWFNILSFVIPSAVGPFSPTCNK